MPAVDRQRQRGQERQRRGHPFVVAHQLPAQRIERRHGQRAAYPRNRAHHQRSGAGQLERQRGKIDERRLDAEIAREEDRVITRLRQHTPGFQCFIRLIVVEAGRNGIQAPKAQECGQGSD